MDEIKQHSEKQKEQKFSEMTTKEIFTDVWRSSEHTHTMTPAESVLLELTARRRLINFLHKKYVIETDNKTESSNVQ